MTYTEYKTFRTACITGIKLLRANSDTKMVAMMRSIMAAGRRQRADYRWSSRNAAALNTVAGYALVNKALRAEQMKRVS